MSCWPKSAVNSLNPPRASDTQQQLSCFFSLWCTTLLSPPCFLVPFSQGIYAASTPTMLPLPGCSGYLHLLLSRTSFAAYYTCIPRYKSIYQFIDQPPLIPWLPFSKNLGMVLDCFDILSVNFHFDLQYCLTLVSFLLINQEAYSPLLFQVLVWIWTMVKQRFKIPNIF